MIRFHFLLLITISFTGLCNAQSTISISSADSISLSKVWNKFVKDLTDKNSTEIKKVSFKDIDCGFCYSGTSHNTKTNNFSAPIDTFIQHFYKWHIPHSKLWKVIKTDKKRFRAELIYGELQQITKLEPKTIIYEVWFHTFKKNELAKGHEGASDYFMFIKSNNTFKFCGLGSVP